MTYLKIRSTPSGAEVLFWGQTMQPAEYTPTGYWYIDNMLKNGKISFTLKKSGYKTQTYTINASGKYKIEYDALLEKKTETAPTPAPTPAPAPEPVKEDVQISHLKALLNELKVAVSKKDVKGAGKIIFEILNNPFGKDLTAGTVPIGFNTASWKLIADNWKLILGGITAIASTTTFISFLYEEALQTVGMGVWVQISNKNWTEAGRQLENARKMLDKAKWFYNWFGWLNPTTFKVFKDYATATETQYKSYEYVIKSKTGAFEDPSKNGKVFDIAEFNKSVKNGTAPSQKDLVTEPITEKPKETVPEVKKKITKQELFNIMKTFYTGRMYMSKKEMEEMLSKYDLSDVMDLVTDARSYYVGRAYMSKKELTDLGSKYGVV